ncbi:hypothetical protein KY389_10665 [Paracoccus bogoriensis]|uniref:hypothetical protein n=1 Tax=Paracoccus bogoriensis TaxID=242065 RepID=UPI001CA5B61E|nr:hypothetical protein [Paracoccus bogoriensis]MBW7057149.1 hypothetical protein [Paracoccus bogoriensis]
MILRALPLCLAVLTAACADRGAYPRLLPTADVLAEPALPAHAVPAATPEGATRIEAAALSRAEALRRRAANLGGPVIEPDLRDRLRGR